MARRRASWLDEESRIAQKSRDGFQKGVLTGLMGMALSGLTKGALNLSGPQKRVYERIPTAEEYFKGRIPAGEISQLRQECKAQGRTLHDALMDRAGWPAIPYDGQTARLPPGRAAHGRQGPGQAPDLPTMCALPTLRPASAATRTSAPRSARAKPSPSIRTAPCPCSTGKNACTAAPACGTAPRRTRPTRNRPTWNSMPGPAACIQAEN